MSEIFDKANALLKEAAETELKSAEALEAFRIRFLGSKNILKPLFGEIRNVANERKKEFGQLLNEIKVKAETAFEDNQAALSGGDQSHQKIDLDLTAPGDPRFTGSRHPISIVMNRIVEIFQRAGFVIAEDRELEDEWHNFTALNTPEHHPARDMTDTFYIQGDPTHCLRSQTSSVQARVMEAQKPPIRIISPGRVYRNETVSPRSHCQFHQVEGLYVDEGVSFADLKQLIHYYVEDMYGVGTKYRLRPSYFPFTEPSAEVDIYWGLNSETDKRITKGTGWLEIMGCGMVDPTVLENCGIDSEKYSGFAFGMGIERQAMFEFRIEDIRMFFENDIRFLKQFSRTH